MNSIRNIFCVGRNYAQHAKELNNDVPTSPMLFSKPTHAVAEANGQDVMLPGISGTIHYEVELVVRMGRPYEKGIKVDDIVNGLALGVDFTLRDVQSVLKQKGHPWLLAKGFRNSALLSKFIEFPGEEACKQTDFALIINEQQVQLGNIKNVIFDLQTIIEFTALHFGLGQGDIIYTGTPEGVGAVRDGDHFSLKWGDVVLGDCKIILGS